MERKETISVPFLPRVISPVGGTKVSNNGHNNKGYFTRLPRGTSATYLLYHMMSELLCAAVFSSQPSLAALASHAGVHVLFHARCTDTAPYTNTTELQTSYTDKILLVMCCGPSVAVSKENARDLGRPGLDQR